MPVYGTTPNKSTSRSSFSSRLNAYLLSPEQFTTDQVDQLEAEAFQYNIPFQRNQGAYEDNLGNTLNQFMSGIVEGFTTLGWADAPQTTQSQIAHSIGHLIGFAPDIIAGILSGGTSIPLSIAKKGVIKGGARKASSAIIRAREGQTAAQKAATAAINKHLGTKFTSPFALKSIPFRAADAIVDRGLGVLAKSKFDTSKFLATLPGSGGHVARDMIHHGTKLGLAMGVSGWKQSFDENRNIAGFAENFGHGFMAGAVFGGIGNFTKLHDWLGSPNLKLSQLAQNRIHTVAKGLAGAGFQGGMATAHGAPLPIQVYEYLLGGFFGASSRPYYMRKGSEFITELRKNPDPNMRISPHKAPGFKDLDLKTQDYVKEHSKEAWGEWVDLPDAARKKALGIIVDEGGFKMNIAIKAAMEKYYGESVGVISKEDAVNFLMDHSQSMVTTYNEMAGKKTPIDEYREKETPVEDLIKKSDKDLYKRQQELTKEAGGTPLSPKPLHYVKPKTGIPFTLFRGLAYKDEVVDTYRRSLGDVEFFSHSPNIAEEYSQKGLNRTILDKTEGDVVVYSPDSQPRVIEIEIIPSKILDTTKKLSADLKRKLIDAGVSKKTVEELDAAKGLKTADLGRLQQNRKFFDVIKAEGYDLIQFMDYTSVGVDLSFVPLGEFTLVAKYDTRMRHEQEAPKEVKWARKQEGGYEVSTKGDKRFSAFNAKLKSGKTIEEAYQTDVKGYKTVKEGKGKPPKDTSIDTYAEYKKLWEQWAKENPELINELAEKAQGKTLTDQFATTDTNQARALSEILNERAMPTEAPKEGLFEAPAEFVDISSSEKKSPYFEKDLIKLQQANKFIAFGEKGTSSASYRETVKDRETPARDPQLNTGEYRSEDVVGYSVNGGKNAEVDAKRVITELNKAIEAGATIIGDVKADRSRSYNEGERIIAKHLESKGYVESKDGVWAPAEKKAKDAVRDIESKASFELKDRPIEKDLKKESLDPTDLIFVPKGEIDRIVTSISLEKGVAPEKVQIDLHDMVAKHNYNPEAILKELSEYTKVEFPTNFRKNLRQWLASEEPLKDKRIYFYDMDGQLKWTSIRRVKTGPEKLYGDGIDISINRILDLNGDSNRVFDTYMDKKGNAIPYMEAKDWKLLEDKLIYDGHGINNMYIYSGIGDNGFLKAREFHPRVPGMKDFQLNDLIKLFPELIKADPDFVHVYGYDLNLEMGRLGITKGTKEYEIYRKRHARKLLSNIYYAQEEAGSIGSYIKDYKDVTGFNKRQKGSYGDEIPFKSEDFSEFLNDKGNFNYKIEVDKKWMGNDSPDSDGSIFIRPDVFEKTLKRYSINEDTDFLKLVIFTAKGGKQLYVKAGGFKEGVDVQKMYDDDVHFILMSSSTKLSANFGKKGEFSPESVKINLNVNEDPGHTTRGNLKIAKPLPQSILPHLMNVVDKTTGEYSYPLEEFVRKITEPSLEGTFDGKPNLDATVDANLIADSKYVPNSINIDKVSSRKILEVIGTRPESNVAKDFIRQIVKSRAEWLNRDGEFGKDPEFDLEYSQMTELAKRLKDGDYNFSIWSREENYRPISKMLTSYILERATRPRWKDSEYAVIRGMRNGLVEALGINEGHFMLGSGARELPIRYEGSKNLGELWDTYLRLKERGEDVSKYEEKLGAVVLRVPAIGFGNIRTMVFDGFVDHPGRTVYINKKDKFRFGGADNDADGLYLYYGMPKEIQDAFRSSLVIKEVEGKDMFDKKYDKLLGTIPKPYPKESNASGGSPLTSPSSVLMPSLRLDVAKHAYRGSQLIGQVVQTFNKLQILMNTVAANGGELTLKGKNGYSYKIEIAKNKGDTNTGEEFRLLAYNEANRALDSSKFPSMADGRKFKEELFKKGFKVTVFKDGKKTGQKARYEDLRNTEFSEINNLNSVYFGRNRGYSKKYGPYSKQWTMAEILEASRDVSTSRINWVGYLPEVSKLLSNMDFSFDPMSKYNLPLMKKYIKQGRDLVRKLDEKDELWYVGREKLNVWSQDVWDKHIYGESKIHLGLNDIDSIEAVKILYPLGKKIVQELKRNNVENPEKVARELIGEMANFSWDVRYKYLKEKGINKLFTGSENDLPELSKELLKTIDIKVWNYKKKLNQKEAVYGMKKNILSDYFDAHLLSPLKPQITSDYAKKYAENIDIIDQNRNLITKLLEQEPTPKIKENIEKLEEANRELNREIHLTTPHTFGFSLMSVPRSIKQKRYEKYDTTIRKMIETEPLKDVKTEKIIQTEQSDPEPTSSSMDTKLREEPLMLDTKKLIDGKMPKLSPNQEVIVDEFVANLKEFPEIFSNFAETMPGIMRRFGKVPVEAESMTFEDMAEFNNLVKHWKKGFAFNSLKNIIKDLKKGKLSFKQAFEKGKLPMRGIYNYLFYDRIGELMIGSDMRMVEQRYTPIMGKNGKLYFSKTKYPSSVMHVIQDGGDHIRANINLWEEKIDREDEQMFNYLKHIQDPEDITQIAIAYRFIKNKNPNIRMSELGNKDNPLKFTDGRNYENKFDRNIMEKNLSKLWEEALPKLLKIQDKVYTIKDESGNDVSIKATDLIRRLNSDITKYVKHWSDIMVHKGYEEAGLYDKNGKLKDSWIEGLLRVVVEEKPFSDKDIRGWGAVERFFVESAMELYIKNSGMNAEKAAEYRAKHRESLKEIPKIDQEYYFPFMGQFSEKWMRAENAKAVEIIFEQFKADLKQNLTKYLDKGTYIGKLYNNGLITKQEAYDMIIERKRQQLEGMQGKSMAGDGKKGESYAEFVGLSERDFSDFSVSENIIKPMSAKSRGSIFLPRFRMDIEVLKDYRKQWIRSYFNSLFGLKSHKDILAFESRGSLGEDTLAWGDFMREVTRRIMGYPTMFNVKTYGLNPRTATKVKDYISRLKRVPSNTSPDKLIDNAKDKGEDDIAAILESIKTEHIKREMTHPDVIAQRRPVEMLSPKKIVESLNSMLSRTNRLKAYNTLYYTYSDEGMTRFLDKLSKKLFKGKVPFYGDLPKDPKARKEVLTRLLHKFGLAEAKWNLITLLAHPKSLITNYIGGSLNTISSAGLRHYRKARDKKWLIENVFHNAEFVVEGKRIPITADTLGWWMESIGVIDSYFRTEAGLDKAFSGHNQKKFINAAVERVTANIKNNKGKINDAETRRTLKELAKQYGVSSMLVEKAGYFMKSSEIWLRGQAFLAHYLNAREAISPVSDMLPWDSPYLIRQGKEGVKATQFIYHSAFRTNYSNTAMGKVMSRFQPFAWNSIKFRRHVYQQAKVMGFKPGTAAFERFQRLMTADLFALALGAIFTSSIFEYGMAPPMSWLQDTAQWAFGDEKERERAFFNAWPTTAMAPFQPVTAPILRYPLHTLNTIINGDLEKFSSLYIHSWYPFGRMFRDGMKTIKSPAMIIENATGFPIHRIHRSARKAFSSGDGGDDQTIEAEEKSPYTLDLGAISGSYGTSLPSLKSLPRLKGL